MTETQNPTEMAYQYNTLPKLVITQPTLYKFMKEANKYYFNNQNNTSTITTNY